MATKKTPSRSKPLPILHIDQLVWVDGHTGNFRIVMIDSDEGVADLALTTGTHHLTRGIPLGCIHPLKEDANQAAARIVREATKD